MAKPSRKSILAIILTLCTALCLGIFAACNDDNDNTTPTDQPVTYTVTIMQDAETPAEGVRVTVSKGSAAFAPKTTGEDGKVTFELVPDDYQLALANLPDHYEAPATGLALNKTNQNVTITLARKPVYKVKLVNPDNTPYYAANVYVGVCDDTSCRTPVAINNQGVAEIEEQTGDYHVQIQGLPADRAYSWVPSVAGNYYKTVHGDDQFLVEEGNMEMTIVIYAVNIIESIVPMTENEKIAYQEEHGEVYFKSGSTAYKVNAKIPANTTVYYSVTPEYSIKYELLGIGNDSSITWLCYSTAFNNNGYQYFPVMEAGKTNYFGITNTDTESEMEVEFVIEAPAASYHEVTSVKNVNVRIDNEDAYVVIEFKPTAAAAYRVIVQGEQTAIELLETETELVNYWGYYGDYEENAECTVRFASDMIGKTVYLVVLVKPEDGKYPATATVEFVKANDLVDTTTDVEVKATLTQFADNEDNEKTLIPIDLDGTDTIYYDEDKGYYRLGDGEDPKASDPIVVVMLKKNLDSDRLYLGEGAPLIYLEMATNGQIAPYVFDVTEDKTDTSKGNSYLDYRKMLRGFVEYDKPSNSRDNLSIPEELEEENCYVNYVNSDGVYPLTEELKEYLQLFAKYAAEYKKNNMGQDLIPEGDENWMFACYYYGVEVVLTDDIIGEYEDEEGNTLTVKSNGKYTITFSYGMTEGGRWKKIESGDEEAKFYLFKGAGSFAGIYDVELKEDGTLEFCYNENDFMYDEGNPFLVAFTFGDPSGNVEKEPLYTLFTEDNGAMLKLYEDGTYEFYMYNRFTQQYGLYISGVYTMSDSGIITINSFKDENDMGYEQVAASYDSAGGKITVTITMAEGEPLEYEFNMDE